MKILHLEDNLRDASLVSDLLESEIPDLEITVVNAREGFLHALEKGGHDVILSDYKLPGFSGRDALKLVRDRRPDVPFIFLSGTVGEDTAAELVREGADDYLLKDRMQRLPFALRRAIEGRVDRQRRRDAEEQFLRAQRMESLGMLAAGIAHDLNNALAPMLMAADLLRPRITDPSDLRVLGMLEQSGGRSAALVRQILSFAAGGRQERVLIQTKHLLRDVMHLMADTFPKSIRLEHETPNSLWTVQGNPTQLHQVLLNLCINARDAMPHGGLLMLRAFNRTLTSEEAGAIADAIAGRFLVIEVQDSGTGISPGILQRIWEPFFTTKEEGVGTGLGLSTVRGIVATHGGFVSIDSEVGHGSTFRIFLPASGEHGDDQSPDSSAHHPTVRGHGERVLVVDDEVAVRETIGAVLSAAGYLPLTMSDGIEVLSKYAHRLGDVSLVISDMDMPGLDGIAFSQAVLHLNPSVKILLISGGSESADGKQARASLGAAFLGKPFSPESLLARVAELLPARHVKQHGPRGQGATS